jgi:hypothetical protein
MRPFGKYVTVRYSRAIAANLTISPANRRIGGSTLQGASPVFALVMRVHFSFAERPEAQAMSGGR